MKRIIFMIIAVVVYTQSGSAQFITRINPANAGDPRVVFANPGAIGFISEPYIVAGYQNLYAGLPGTLTNSQIGAVLPTRFGHFAITGQNFTASMLSSSAIDLRYAYHLDKYRTSLGFSLGSLFTSYDKSRFHIIDDDDPLLSGDLSVNALDLGIGLTSNVWKNLILGINIDHLNKPALSLQGDFKKDMFLRAGFMYEFDRFKPMVMWEQEEGEHYFSAGTEYWFNNLPAPDVTALARAFVAPEYFSLGAGLIYKKLRLDYLFDYPLGDFGDLAGGTHQFVAAYTLAQSPFTLDVELMKPNVAEPARVPWCREVIYRINVIPAGGFNESVTLTMEDADGRSAARTITYDAEFGREIRKNDGEIGLDGNRPQRSNRVSESGCE